jgi:hypothetical protein
MFDLPTNKPQLPGRDMEGAYLFPQEHSPIHERKLLNAMDPDQQWDAETTAFRATTARQTHAQTNRHFAAQRADRYRHRRAGSGGDVPAPRRPR